MKFKSKRLAGILMAILMVVVMLSGCTTETAAPVTEKETKATNTEVMGKVNDVEITREMLGEALTKAEKTVIEEYINGYLLTEYYKDIEVTDVEIEAQLAIVKGQIGETKWESYLQYIGMADEEAFKEAIEKDLKATKKRDELKKGINLTDEELEKHYTDYKNSFDIMVGKILFFDTEEEYSQAKVLFNAGKTMQKVSEEMGKDIYENEHVSFEFAGFEKPMAEIKIGETVYTKMDSGTFAVMVVEKIDNTFEVLKETVKEDLLNTKSQELVNKELENYYNAAKVTIMGEDIKNNPVSESEVGSEVGSEVPTETPTEIEG